MQIRAAVTADNRTAGKDLYLCAVKSVTAQPQGYRSAFDRGWWYSIVLAFPFQTQKSQFQPGEAPKQPKRPPSGYRTPSARVWQPFRKAMAGEALVEQAQ